METVKKGETTSLDILSREIELHGLKLLDVGCGSLGFTRQLLSAGCNVVGIDPDPIQATKNRIHPDIADPDELENFSFIEAGAEEIPLDSDIADGVVFSFSLHHIPESLYWRVFDEVQRLLRKDGFLCVIEPTDGPLNQVLKLFHDEDHERDAAQHALRTCAAPLFFDCQDFSYHSYIEYDSFEQFAAHFAKQSFNELYSEEDVYQNSVREKFESLGAPDYRFFSPKKMFLGKRLVPQK